MKPYVIEECVQIAKRDHNTKRPYLLVNPLQGKHIPVQPKKALALFDTLAKKTYDTFLGETLLFIGFAETATAIGAAVACASSQSVFYLQTTREPANPKDCLYFSEVHSHATQQKLMKTKLDSVIASVDRIVFVEDEVTTGNTILNMITVLQQEFPTLSLQFGITSILNGISPTQEQYFQERQIPCVYLFKLPNRDFAADVQKYSFSSDTTWPIHTTCEVPKTQVIADKLDPRIGVENLQYHQACEKFTASVLQRTSYEALEGKSILVLGTEEFMYPPLYFANALDSLQLCKSVQFHATTRSPILPSTEKGYPLFSRYQLWSCYEKQRTTFLYNLQHYDHVFLLHDATQENHLGIQSIVSALQKNHCSKIEIYQWSD